MTVVRFCSARQGTQRGYLGRAGRTSRSPYWRGARLGECRGSAGPMPNAGAQLPRSYLLASVSCPYDAGCAWEARVPCMLQPCMTAPQAWSCKHAHMCVGSCARDGVHQGVVYSISSVLQHPKQTHKSRKNV